jgi:UPF0755 protein
MKRFIGFTFLLMLLVAGAAAGWMHHFAHAKLEIPATANEFTVKQGASLKAVSKQLVEKGLLSEPNALWILGRIVDKTKIQAGTYRLDEPITPLDLLEKMNIGDVVLAEIRFVEGGTFGDMLKVLADNKAVKQTLGGVSRTEVWKRIETTEKHPEGLLFPDTYQFAPGTTDLEILKRSYKMMQKKLDEAWMQREKDLPYKSPYEALTMASIIEKETGKAEERPLIASVFINRLRIPMRLQTDPTVIYGMGESYDGNIRKRDLTTDTPYNTYTRDGLPPTPIAMPGWGSLIASVKPLQSNKLYFVGKGDGTHYFSASLDEHNRAVSKYQLGR